MKRESFIFYQSFLNCLQDLPPATASNVLYAICTYGINGEILELNGVEKAIFTLIKPQIDANNKKFVNGQKGSEFGKLGGRPKKSRGLENNPSGVLSETPNVNDNVNDNVKVYFSNQPFEKEYLPKEAIQLATLIFDKHQKEFPDFCNNNTLKNKKINDWAKDIEKLMRIDCKSYSQIEAVINWAKSAGNFWLPNIISGKKLREKFDMIYAQMQNQKNKGGYQNKTTSPISRDHDREAKEKILENMKRRSGLI